MNIEGVPESITRADYLRLIEGVGLDIKRVRALEFRTDGIYVDTHACRPGEPDSRILTTDGYNRDECATHRIFIPVVD